MRLGAEDFNKLDFLDLFARIYTETFRSSTIQGAWRATGLVPYEPEIILRHLREQQVQRLTTPLSTLSCICAIVPLAHVM